MHFYVVMTDGTGKVLIANKGALKYYKGDGERGRVYPDGKPPYGPDAVGLPYGRSYDAPTEAEAREVFLAQTGESIRGGDFTLIDFDGFCAAYFVTSTANFFFQTNAIIKSSLPAGEKVARLVAHRELRRYRDVIDDHPTAPFDNELRSADVWDVQDPDVWAMILDWRNDGHLDEYFRVLKYLKDNLVDSADGDGGPGGDPPVYDLNPTPTRAEQALTLRDNRRYFRSLGLGSSSSTTVYDPTISDSNGLVSYLNATTNEPPPELVEERREISAVLEGLTGIVVAAVLETAGQDDKAKHDPGLWEAPIRYGLSGFTSGMSVETVTYQRRVRGVDVATEFLNILMNAVTDAGAALTGFRNFIQSQGDTMGVEGKDTEEGYRYACLGIVHEIFQISDDEWIYMPKIRGCFTSFDTETFKINAGCFSYHEFDFNFKVETIVAPFRIETWRRDPEFRKDVDNFIKELTGAKIDQSRNYFKDIFKARPASAILIPA